MNENHGALPPPDFTWQIGKTAPSIRFVREAEHYLSACSSTHDQERIKKVVEEIKVGALVLEQWLTIEEFLQQAP